MSGRARFKNLLEPLQVRQVRFRNRMIKPAQRLGFAGRYGDVGQKNIDFYEALAKGGAGSIITSGRIAHWVTGHRLLRLEYR